MTNELLSSPAASTSKPAICLAEPQDLAGCIACLFDAGIPIASLSERLSKLIDDRQMWIIRGEADGVLGTLGIDDTACRRSLYVELIGVLPEFRKQGLALMLIDHAAKIARSRGIKRVIAAIPKGNDSIAKVIRAWGGNVQFRRPKIGGNQEYDFLIVTE